MPESAAYTKPWAVLWVAAVLALAYVAVTLAIKWRGWARGAPLPPAPRPAPARVAGIWLAEVLAQRQLLQLSPLRWAAHFAIVWGFAGLLLLSALHVVLPALAALSLDLGLAAWLLRGGGRGLAKAWGNGWGLVLLAGLVLALLRRLARRGADAAGEKEAKEADLPLVVFLLVLTLSGFLLEGLRHALAAAAPQRAAALRPWLTALWTAHGLGGVALVAWLPRSTLLHALLSPLVIALNARAEHPRRDLYWPKTTGHGAGGSPRA
jgi:nitrate reductase gamma subunit